MWDVAVAVIDDRAAEQNVHDLVADGYRLLASVEQDAGSRRPQILARGRHP